MSSNAPDDFEALKAIVEALKPFPKEDQERILRWTREKFGLSNAAVNSSITADRPISAVERATSGEAPSTSSSSRAPDIKAFMNAKNPSSDNQFAAAVAYYYQFEAPETLRKMEIVPADLQEAARLSGRSRLGDPGKTLRNAHQQGYFDQAGRGSFSLSTVGENLVAMALPQADGKTRVVTKQRRTAKAKGPKKKK
jgi:hypothetical protein